MTLLRLMSVSSIVEVLCRFDIEEEEEEEEDGEDEEDEDGRDGDGVRETGGNVSVSRDREGVKESKYKRVSILAGLQNSAGTIDSTVIL